MKSWHFQHQYYDGPYLPCDPACIHNRLRTSPRALDALAYAQGPIVHLIVDEHAILQRFDASRILRAFARDCALAVAHLWPMPDTVRRYLEDDQLHHEAAWVATATHQALHQAAAIHDATGATLAAIRHRVLDVPQAPAESALCAARALSAPTYTSREATLDRMNTALEAALLATTKRHE